MTKTTLNPPELFDSLQFGFSQIVIVTGGTTVYLSGQVAWDENREIVGAGDLKAQTHQTLKNIETAMEAAGGTLQDVVSMRIYVVDGEMENGHLISDALRGWFSAEQAPSTTWIAVTQLANPDFLIEIEAVGVIHNDQP